MLPHELSQDIIVALSNRISDFDQKIEDVKNILLEISEGKGAFNRDPHTHAANCIRDMKILAVKGLKLLEAEED